MPLPPFELVYDEHRDEIYGFMRKRLREADAADAFQETFLRALRSYPGLAHGRELRAWLYTIARSVIADGARRASARPPEVLVDDPSRVPLGARERTSDVLDPSANLTGLAGLDALAERLPPTERAAVVLRYRFDLSYDEIGVALEASPDAARQAASSGVRRLRRELVDPSTETEERS